MAAIIGTDLAIIDLDLEQENGLDESFLALHDFQEILKQNKNQNGAGSVLPNVPSPLSKGIFS